MFEKVKNQDHLLGKTNRIVDGTTITGDITTFADFRLDGKLKGNFTSEGKIVIPPMYYDAEPFANGRAVVRDTVNHDNFFKDGELDITVPSVEERWKSRYESLKHN